MKKYRLFVGIFVFYFLQKFECQTPVNVDQDEYILPCQKLERLKYSDDSPVMRSNFKRGIIQSPNYPAPYSKNENCIFSINAPKNYVIVLKHYEKFSLEPSDGCTNDYVEIRDGKYGYSPLIGIYCDSHLPKFPIQSSSNELWIKFDTDDSIESDGFRIYFELKRIKDHNLKEKMKNSKCELDILPVFFTKNLYGSLTNNDIDHIQDKQLESFLIKSSLKQGSKMKIDKTLDCTIHIEVDNFTRIFLWIDLINITLISNSSSSIEVVRRYNCTENFVEIYDGSTALIDKKHQFCNSVANKFFKSQTNKIFIRYNWNRAVEHHIVEFKFTYNPYEIGPCKNHTYQCSDQTCINEQLYCNGIKNCNFVDDESNCHHLLIAKRKNKENWSSEQKMIMMHKIIIIILGATLGLFIIISITVSCKKSISANQRRKKTKEESIEARQFVVTKPISIHTVGVLYNTSGYGLNLRCTNSNLYDYNMTW